MSSSSISIVEPDHEDKHGVASRGSVDFAPQLDAIDAHATAGESLTPHRLPGYHSVASPVGERSSTPRREDEPDQLKAAKQAASAYKGRSREALIEESLFRAKEQLRFNIEFAELESDVAMLVRGASEADEETIVEALAGTHSSLQELAGFRHIRTRRWTRNAVLLLRAIEPESLKTMSHSKALAIEKFVSDVLRTDWVDQLDVDEAIVSLQESGCDLRDRGGTRQLAEASLRLLTEERALVQILKEDLKDKKKAIFEYQDLLHAIDAKSARRIERDSNEVCIRQRLHGEVVDVYEDYFVVDVDVAGETKEQLYPLSALESHASIEVGYNLTFDVIVSAARPANAPFDIRELLTEAESEKLQTGEGIVARREDTDEGHLILE